MRNRTPRRFDAFYHWTNYERIDKYWNKDADENADDRAYKAEKEAKHRKERFYSD